MTSVNQTLLKRIDEIFVAKLQSKTGWGRNDVLSAYRDSVREALMELLT